MTSPGQETSSLLGENVSNSGTLNSIQSVNSYGILQENLGDLLRDEANGADPAFDEERTLRGTPNSSTSLVDKAPRLTGTRFVLLEASIFLNVFLSGFDSTVTASSYMDIGSYFNAANVASWVTTAYLITSTAFQPLYGSFSDILGRRKCFMAATIIFGIGCLGCGLANNILVLDIMRAVSGIGGGGLITMSTIINSDIIPFHERGMYQASQNVCYGLGATIGASLGGTIAMYLGWRWIFLLQVPMAFGVVVMGYLFVTDQANLKEFKEDGMTRYSLRDTDVHGAVLLVTSLCFQLLLLSCGGNQLEWTDWRIIWLGVFTVITMVAFVVVESKDRGIRPIMPMFLLKGSIYSNLVLFSNVFAGMAAYAYLFELPIFFQVVLGDDLSRAGLRLAIPSLATPVGGLMTGYFMSHYDCLGWLVRGGTLFMVIGCFLTPLIGRDSSAWQVLVYLLPSNTGQGMAFPALLFTFMTAFDHEYHAVSTSLNYLFRNLGMVWGVSAVSAIIQNSLKSKLPEILKGEPNAEELIESIRQSITTIWQLEPRIQELVRHVYGDAIIRALRITGCFATLASIGAVSYGFTRRPNKQCRLTANNN